MMVEPRRERAGVQGAVGTRATDFLQRPGVALPTLLGIAMAVEGAQYVPEIVPGGHAFGEVVRNLAYGLFGAVIFHWLIVELPDRRRRAASYVVHKQTFQTLLAMGPGLLHQYQTCARHLGVDLDIWDRTSIFRMARRMEEIPGMLGPRRAGLLRSTVDIALPRCLADLGASLSFIDQDVAQALARFPRHDGIQFLQVVRTEEGALEAHSDAHVTWTLLEAARHLYRELLATGAFGPEVFEATVNGEQLDRKVLLRESTN